MLKNIFQLAIDAGLGKVALDKLTAAIDDYLKNDQFILSLTAWEYKKNFLVLKFNLWNDRKNSVITNIQLENTVENLVYECSNYPINPSGELLFIDPSQHEESLKEYEHYYSQALSISETPRSLSIVFKLDKDIDLKFLELVLKSNNKIQKFNIRDLIKEVPTICEYVKKKGFDPQKLYDAMCL